MLKINNNTKIRSFDYSYSDFNNRLISIYFNTRNTVISSPKILIALAGLNGAMTENEWLNWSSKLLSIPQSKSQHILDEFREWGILHSIDNHPYSNKQINHSAFKEKNKTQPILICDINPVTEYIVCFLQMFGFENISFLNDMTIDEELVNNSVLFSSQDIGKSFTKTLNFQLDNNSDPTNRKIDEIQILIDPKNNCSDNDTLTFSSLHYSNMKKFGECRVFDEIKQSSTLIRNICTAIYLVEDILYSIHCGTVV